MITQRERANAPSLSLSKCAKNIENRNILFILAFLYLYLVFLLCLCYTANRGMCPISRPQTACLCDSPFDRSRRRDINRRPTEYRLTDRKRKRAKKPTAHGHNRVAVSSKQGKGKCHRTQRSMRKDFVRFFIPVSRFTFAGEESVC